MASVERCHDVPWLTMPSKALLHTIYPVGGEEPPLLMEPKAVHRCLASICKHRQLVLFQWPSRKGD